MSTCWAIDALTKSFSLATSLLPIVTNYILTTVWQFVLLENIFYLNARVFKLFSIVSFSPIYSDLTSYILDSLQYSIYVLRVNWMITCLTYTTPNHPPPPQIHSVEPIVLE